MQWRVPLFDPDLGEAEKQAVTSVICSKWLTMGDRTAELETRFAAFLGSRHAVALNSCTAALHLALLGVGVEPGDDVVCPSLTFVATANAIRYCGAQPVFADVASLDNWNVSRATLEAVVTPQTKALIVVHYAGFPCDMPAIMTFAQSRGLAVVEDSAHAPGACLDGKAAGTWGDCGCFSFFSNKNMTTGEGGMLLTDQDAVAERIIRLRSHGMTTLTLDRYKGHAFSYDVLDLGYNYRMGELNAALGLAQLAQLTIRNQQRRLCVERYWQHLFAIPALSMPFQQAPGQSAYHLMPVLLPPGCERQRVMATMQAAGVQTSIHYRPIDTFTAYVEAGLGPGQHLVHTHEIGKRALTLPLYPSMSPKQIDYVCRVLREALDETRVA